MTRLAFAGKWGSPDKLVESESFGPAEPIVVSPIAGPRSEASKELKAMLPRPSPARDRKCLRLSICAISMEFTAFLNFRKTLLFEGQGLVQIQNDGGRRGVGRQLDRIEALNDRALTVVNQTLGGFGVRLICLPVALEAP